MRQSYLKNAALMTGADVLLRLAGMGLRIWLANALGGEGMGLYQLVLAVYSLFVTLATAGVSVAATRLMAEELARSPAEAWRRSSGWRVSPQNGGWAMSGRRGRCVSRRWACRGWRCRRYCGAFSSPGGRWSQTS